MNKNILTILTVNIISLIIFSAIVFMRGNYEFAIYIGVILFFIGLLLASYKKIKYSNPLLWGLTIWSILHMAGGNLYYQGVKFYDLIIWPIIGEPYNILKYDQIIHTYGFFVGTIAVWEILKPFLKEGFKFKLSLMIVIVMAGLGFGALNEIIEFMATVVMKETGVGGYVNNSLDLVFDLIGAIVAMALIATTNKNKTQITKI